MNEHPAPQPRPAAPAGGKKRFVFNQTFFLFLVIVAISIFVGWRNPRFATYKNLAVIFQQTAVLGIVTMSMVFMLISGLLDLSVGGMIGLAAVTVCKLTQLDYPMWQALGAGVLVCLACGCLNGLIVARTRCVPLIATLGLSSVYYGLALVVSRGLQINLKGDFEFLGRHDLFDVFPMPMVVFILIVVFTWFVLKHTAFGRRITAMGGNEEVAYLAGIDVFWYKVANYTLSSALCAVSVLVLVSRLGVVTSGIGNDYTLRALAAAVIGGVTFEGGRGTVLGAFFGALLLGLVANALNILQVSSYYQTVVLGLIIVCAVVVSSIGKRS